MTTKHILITGLVQGVFFRATAKKIANGLSMGGWIKNTLDGNVEVQATGSAESMNEFEKWCREGPANAIVHSATATDRELILYNDFTIIK